MLDLKNSTYADIRPRKRTLFHRFELWMINDGKMYLYFGFWIVIQALLFSLAIVNYLYYPMWQDMKDLLGASFITARSSALALHVDTALVLFPVCRTVISWIRTTPLNRIIPFDHALLFHMVIGYSIVFFTLVHMGSHYRNYYMVSQATGVPYWRLLFTTGHSITGHIMTLCMIIMGVTGASKFRRKHFNVFWNLHHLFVVYFACFSIHGAFCLLKPNSPPYCSSGGNFWKYWLASGLVYLFERLSREFRASWRSREMRVQKVILHPGKVIEVQFRKPRAFKGLAGQYAFLNCPAVSTQQWHPFTLTSAPEEDYVSMHIRLAGDWTKAFAETLGASEEHWKALEQSLGEVDSRTQKRPAKRPITGRKSVAQGVSSGYGRDSMAYTPVQRAQGQRRNTALSEKVNRRHTMLLVDQSDDHAGGADPYDVPPVPGMPAYATTGRNSSSLVSRLSQYLGAGGPQHGSVGRGSFSHMTGLMPAAVAPKMPSLKQLQDHYLRGAGAQSGGGGHLHQPIEEYEMTATGSSAHGSGSTVAEDNGMQQLKDIVNGGDEWETLPVAANRLGPEPVAHMSANILPQVLVDGPFGSASEDVFNHEIAMLFCAGIGCTPFASVLKSIWYRLSYPEGSFRLRKVYFFWVQRDTKSFEWFQDLLKAIEEEDDARMLAPQEDGAPAEKMIEIHTYLTGKLNMTQMEHVHMNEDELDPITGLRSPTNFGRPNTDLIFRAVAHEHPATDVGVFFCGPVKLGSTIESAAKKWSSEGQDGTKFYYNKENF
ncbi:hypothetical protein H4218_006129 [Coemansia sp. IMI 209128]|uniref:FAD-binding FR-type domain-containing protein n=1 Tax=Coemansia spiralis TaxID=417178 RepID=A0A9W8L4I9_9FUNG|nr:hypothetical protein IWW39_002384 [Coemansia spiralis]KAJ2693209.1 hypothetical protein H4218_006129 [Coemansia sp. IMI 209128]